MKFFKILTLNLIILSYSNAEGYEKTAQYDSLKIKISQMLIFGIQDAQKVLEEDSLLEAYENMHLGGIILFEKNLAKKRSKNQLKALVDEIQRISKIPSFVAIDEEGGNVTRLKSQYGFHETKTAKYLGNRNNLSKNFISSIGAKYGT